MKTSKQHIERVEHYAPVPHDEAFAKRLLADMQVKSAYDALEEEFAALDARLTARKDSGSA